MRESSDDPALSHFYNRIAELRNRRQHQRAPLSTSDLQNTEIPSAKVNISFDAEHRSIMDAVDELKPILAAKKGLEHFEQEGSSLSGHAALQHENNVSPVLFRTSISDRLETARRDPGSDGKRGARHDRQERYQVALHDMEQLRKLNTEVTGTHEGLSVAAVVAHCLPCRVCVCSGQCCHRKSRSGVCSQEW